MRSYTYEAFFIYCIPVTLLKNDTFCTFGSLFSLMYNKDRQEGHSMKKNRIYLDDNEWRLVISQVSTSKSPARVMQEIYDTALSYAEIKALATGNPLIIERCNVEAEVNKLNMLKSSHLSQRYELEDKVIKHYPAEIARLEERITKYKEDIMHLAENTDAGKEQFSPMKIGETVYADKKEAGKALILKLAKQ